MDQWTITKPTVSFCDDRSFIGSPSATAGGALVYTVLLKNNSTVGLNGTQVRLTLAVGMTAFSGTQGDTMIVQGSDVVVTLGRMAARAQQVVQIPTHVSDTAAPGTAIAVTAVLTAGTRRRSQTC